MMSVTFEKYEAYKDSGIEWLDEVPVHWEVKKVKEAVIKIGNGVTPRGGSEVYTESGVPFLRSQNVYDDGLRLTDVSHIPAIIHKEMRNSQLKAYDILINITGASIGRTCIVPADLSSANINQHISFLRIKKRFNVFYIALFLKSPLIKDYIQFEQNGASKEAFTLNQIANIPLILPPRSEQTTIATYLDTKTAQIDRQIDLLTQKAMQYNKLKQSLINETIIGGLDKTVPMKDSGVEWIGEVPAHWTIRRVKDLFRLVTDIAPDNNNYELLSLYTSIGVKPRKDMEQRGNKASSTDGYWRVKKGDIVVNKLLAWMGAIGLSEYDGVTSPAYDILRKITINISEEYYALLFRTVKAQEIFKKSSHGIMDMRLRLYFDKFGGINMPVPPFDEQTAISNYLAEKTTHIDCIVTTIQIQINKLKELRKTLINDVVTGKIKVV